MCDICFGVVVAVIFLSVRIANIYLPVVSLHYFIGLRRYLRYWLRVTLHLTCCSDLDIVLFKV